MIMVVLNSANIVDQFSLSFSHFQYSNLESLCLTPAGERIESVLYLQLEMSLICSRDEQDGFLAVSSFFSGNRGSFVVVRGHLCHSDGNSVDTSAPC